MSSNKGILGVESIRLGGMSFHELPIAEGAGVRPQIPKVLESDRENRIRAIKAKYPTQSIAWIDGAIRECEVTIRNVRRLKDEQQKLIDDYTGLISLCDHRDKELAKTDDPEAIKALKKSFPPYNVEAMRIQIRLSKEAIVRSDEVIDKEHKSISELRDLRTLCVKRDEELLNP
jgi:hypothetical protein